MDAHLGRLAVGRLADMVVLNFQRPHPMPLLNTMGTLVDDACGRDVEHVFCDGRHVIRDGQPTMVDGNRVRAEAQRAGEAL